MSSQRQPSSTLPVMDISASQSGPIQPSRPVVSAPLREAPNASVGDSVSESLSTLSTLSTDLDPTQAMPNNIEMFRQNKPSRIVRDLVALGLTSEQAYEVLLARGVFKWMSVRRSLIKQKDIWKEQINEIQTLIRENKQERRSLAQMELSLKSARLASVQTPDAPGLSEIDNLLRTTQQGIEMSLRTYARLKGQLAVLVEVRQQIREMCHSSRWQTPDNDPEAERWLIGREKTYLLNAPVVESANG